MKLKVILINKLLSTYMFTNFHISVKYCIYILLSKVTDFILIFASD